MAAPEGSPRSVVLEALKPTGLKVVQGRLPTNIADPTLTVTTGEIENNATAGTGWLWTVTVTVLTPLIGETADDDLERTVLDVLGALLAAQPLTFAGGRRTAVAGDAYNAYELDVTVITQRSQP
jgi:hypothetical protein